MKFFTGHVQDAAVCSDGKVSRTRGTGNRTGERITQPAEIVTTPNKKSISKHPRRRLFLPASLACLLTVLLTVMLLGGFSVTTHAENIWPTAPEIESKSALVMEVTTSSVLYEKDADEKRYPASTTKIMTCLLALENSSMDEIVTFSERAVSLEEAAVTIDAVAGEQMTMKDCLYGLMVKSGNDCANAIAEHVGGSIEGFADMMNERAAEIGCTGTHFTNPHGLFDENHYTTSRDLALIAQEAYNNSDFIELISTQTYKIPPTNMYDATRTLKNWNLHLMEDSEYYNPEVIGGKTGFLDESGRCLVTYAQRNGFTAIVVQMKGPYTEIFGEATQLLNYTFDNFSLKNAGENESRFTEPTEQAKVLLDPAASVLTLNTITFDQLESSMLFADEMEAGQKAEAEITAAQVPGRSLYGVINYSYAGHDLGSVNIYEDADLVIAQAGFTNICYISPVYLALLALVVLILSFSLYAANKKKRTNRRRPVRRNETNKAAR